jgi:hypothetical protein
VLFTEKEMNSFSWMEASYQLGGVVSLGME